MATDGLSQDLRDEAARAVYHVIARGDGGKNVFDSLCAGSGDDRKLVEKLNALEGNMEA